ARARSARAEAGLPVRGSCDARCRGDGAAPWPRADRPAQSFRALSWLPDCEGQPHLELGRTAPVPGAAHLRRNRRVGLPQAFPALRRIGPAAGFLSGDRYTRALDRDATRPLPEECMTTVVNHALRNLRAGK